MAKPQLRETATEISPTRTLAEFIAEFSYKRVNHAGSPNFSSTSDWTSSSSPWSGHATASSADQASRIAATR